MMKRVILPALFMAAAFCFSGCKSASADTDEELPVQIIHVDWEYICEDIEEMTGTSDLIALIQVDSLSEQSAGSTSVFDVTVKEAVYGCEAEQIIQITMQGGRAKYAMCIVPEDPLMEPGQEFLIFANKREDDTYSIINGQYGRFLYEDGLLNALQYTDLPEKPGGGFDVKEKPLDEMLEELQAVLP